MADLKPSELRELAELYRKKGDLEKEREVLLMLKPTPSMRPTTAQDILVQDPERGVGLIGGELRNPGFIERESNPALRNTQDSIDRSKDAFELALATGGSMLAPPLAVASAANRATTLSKIATPFIRNSPKILGAGTGGSLASAGTEMTEEDSDLLSMLAAGGEGFKEYATAEATGVGLGSLLSTGVNKFIGPQVDDAQRAALEFAKKENAPIPLSIVKEGAGALAEKASGLTFFGNMVRRNKANKINKIIELQSRALTPLAKPPEVVAPRAAALIDDVLSNASDAKNTAYKSFETAIGKDTVIPDSTIRQAASEALDKARAQGKKFTAKNKLLDLEEWLKYEGQRTFDDLERFRKDTLKSIIGNYETKEIGQIVGSAMDDLYTNIGRTKGIDLTASIKEAESLVKKLSALEKIPGMKDFRSVKRSDAGYIISLVNENNSKALDIIKQKAPDLYKSLTEQRLAMSFFNRNGEWSPSGFVKYIRDNPTFIENTFGKEQKKVLNNFAAYIEATSDFAGKQSIGDALSSFGGPAMAGLVGRDLGTVVGTESGGVVLAYQLTNPNSPLFKIFSETDPIKLGKVIEESTPFVTRAMVEEFERQ